MVQCQIDFASPIGTVVISTPASEVDRPGGYMYVLMSPVYGVCRVVDHLCTYDVCVSMYCVAQWQGCWCPEASKDLSILFMSSFTQSRSVTAMQGRSSTYLRRSGSLDQLDVPEALRQDLKHRPPKYPFLHQTRPDCSLSGTGCNPLKLWSFSHLNYDNLVNARPD